MVPNLKEMAIVSVAIALWNHIDMPYIIWRRHKDPDEWRRLRSEVSNLANDLSLPPSEKDLVRQSVHRILPEMDAWVSYHYQSIFFKRGSSNYLYCHMSKFAWCPDGTIDYKKTALNLQSSLRLNDLEKFRFLCVYCLVDEIEQKWPWLVENQAFDCAEFIDHPLIFYWHCHCRNELNKIPVTTDLSIDSTMFQLDDVDIWSAKEYFFDRMNAEEQVQNAAWVIDELDAPVQKLVLKKLSQHQLTQIYVNNAPEIMANYSSNMNYFGDILTTWSDLKDLINEEQFMSIIGDLFFNDVDHLIVTEIWITASDQFKLCVLNLNNEECLRKIWNCWIKAYDYDSFLMLIEVSVDIRSEIRKKKVFEDHCADLIFSVKLSMLERILNLCFPKDEEVAAFKSSLTQKESFSRRCRELISIDDVSTLERLLNLCLCDVDNLARFKEQFTGEQFFVDRCFSLICSSKLSALEQLLNLFFSAVEKSTKFKQDFVERKLFKSVFKKRVLANDFSSLEQLVDLFFIPSEQFKQDFIKDKFFNDLCENLIIEVDISKLEALLNFFLVTFEELTRFKKELVEKELFSNQCRKLITSDKLPKLEVLTNFMFTSIEELASFKRSIAKNDFFKDHCLELISYSELSTLNLLLTWCYTDTQELIEFKHNLVASKSVHLRYLRYYATANLKGLNDLMKLLLFPRIDIIIEHKQKFLLSEDGFKACIALCNWPENVLNEVISDCLPQTTGGSLNEFKKVIIFSPAIIAKLRRMILRNRMNDVKNCVNNFLANDDDVRALKWLILDNSDELITMLFLSRKYDETTRQSWISWLFQDGQSTQWKRRIPIDTIFQEMLKECVFQTYDQQGRFSRCTLNTDFKFDILNGFLKWCFESPKESKAYKIRMIDQYKELETICTLVKKRCHVSYWTKLSNWFFEKDPEEIAKFKKKHRGEKIARLLKFVRESYFKRKK